MEYVYRSDIDVDFTPEEIADTIQIEVGSVATEYEPYREETVTTYLNEPLRKCGDVADYMDWKSRKVVRKIKQVIVDSFDADLGWGLSTLGVLDDTYMYNMDWLSSHEKNDQIGAAEQQIVVGENDNRIYFRGILNNIGAANVHEANAWIAENPITVLYATKNPTEEDITAPPLPLKDGNNNVFATTAIAASKMKVEYCQNPTLVIEELRNAILAQGGNV